MRTVIAPLMALAVGVGVGYLLGGSQSTPVRASREPSPVVAPREPVQPSPEQRADLARALEAIPYESPPTGSGEITGSVRTTEGKPVEGVTVRATLRHNSAGTRAGEGPPVERSLEEEVRRYVRNARRTRAARREAVTDGTGAYTLQGLAEGATYVVRAYLEGYELNAVDSSAAWRATPGSTIDFHARELVDLPVDVLLPDGSRPGNAEITVRYSTGPSSSTTWTPGRPVLRARPGHCRVKAAISGSDQYSSDEQRVELAVGGTPATLVFRMRSRPGIRGRVIFPNGEVVGYLDAYLLELPAGQEPNPDLLTRNGKHAWAAADSGHAFTYKDLEPGRYLVGVALGRGVLLAHRTVELADRFESCDFEIREFDPSLFLVLRVYGPDGKPLTEVEVDTSYRTPRSSSSGGGKSIRRKDGSFLVAHHEVDDPQPGAKYGVEVVSEQYGRKEVSYKREEGKEIEIRFREAATVAVTIAGYVGSGHEGAITVYLREPGEHSVLSGQRSNNRPAAGGRIELGPVEPGEYEVALYAGGLLASATAVRLRAGGNEAAVPMPSLHPLTIVVSGGKEGETVHLRKEYEGGWSGTNGQLDKQGTVTFPALPPGDYRARVNLLGEMRIAIPGPARVEFAPEVQNAIRVKITDATGSFAKAGFVDGDLVVGIDGQEFKNMLQMQMLFAAAAGKQQASLILLRGARRVELTVNLRELMASDENRGGSFDTTRR